MAATFEAVTTEVPEEEQSKPDAFAVVKEAFIDSPAHHAEALASMAKLGWLWSDLGLTGPVDRRLWKLLGLWSQDSAAPARSSEAAA